MSDDNEYGDGYDSELVGDEEDRAKLRAMTELQREQVIADRMENRQRLQERRRILRMAKEKDAATKAARNVTSKRTLSLTRQSRRVAGEGTDSRDRRMTALDSIAQKRKERRDKKPGSWSKAEVVSEEDELEEDKYDDNSMRKEIYARPSRLSQFKQEEEEEYDDEDEDREEGGLSQGDVEHILLRRSKLERWITEPFFDECVPRCFVRIGIGIGSDQQNKYRLAEIVEVAQGQYKNYPLREYEISPGSGKLTGKVLVV